MKKVGVEVVIVKKQSRKFQVRHPDGSLNWVEDVPAEMYKRLNVGDTITAIEYATEEERDRMAEEMKRGNFPEIERPEKN